MEVTAMRIPNFFIFTDLSLKEIPSRRTGRFTCCPRLPDFLAWSSPGAPHRGGGLPIDEPGLYIDALDRVVLYQSTCRVRNRNRFALDRLHSRLGLPYDAGAE